MGHDRIVKEMAPKTFLELVEDVESRAPLASSRDHGSHHWRLVCWAGARLLETTSGVDPTVVVLFGLFHDSQRENEFDDPEHGERGGHLARELIPRYLPDVSTAQIDVIVQGCALHTEAGPTDDPTLGVCWDADRLNLWRVGKEPLPRYLSTLTAKKPETIEWARHLQAQDFPWESVHRAISEAAT